MDTREILLQIVAESEKRELSEGERFAVQEIVLDHDWAEANAMPAVASILRRLLVGEISSELTAIPSGYPHGSSGFANVFEDLAEKFNSVTWEDHGEHAIGELRGLQRSVYLAREGSSPCVAVRPIEPLGELNAWLRRVLGR